jgi:hypothetical protein
MQGPLSASPTRTLLKTDCRLNCMYLVRGERSSAGRASVCGTEGRGFKPRRSPQQFLIRIHLAAQKSTSGNKLDRIQE